jgi:hypothetical protein
VGDRAGSHDSLTQRQEQFDIAPAVGVHRYLKLVAMAVGRDVVGWRIGLPEITRVGNGDEKGKICTTAFSHGVAEAECVSRSLEKLGIPQGDLASLSRLNGKHPRSHQPVACEGQ